MGSQHETGFLHVIAQKTGGGGRMNFTERARVLDIERHILKTAGGFPYTHYSKKSTEVLKRCAH